MDLLKKLYAVNLFAEKTGLENMHRACKLIGYPRFPSIHVAGTNGKGSVCTKIAYGLPGKVGLFTSPHISRFNERIQINGEHISDEDLYRLLEKTFALIEKHQIPATFFEITTLVAFQYFEEQKVDMAVLETGLGGRLDATNVVTPLLSIITSISLEHTEILGKDLTSITREKAGVIKPGVPVIVGPTVDLPGIKIEGSFHTYDEENAAIAKAALQLFGVKEVPNIKPPCRLEIHPGPIIFDVAHNPDGLKRLFEALNHQKLHIVCGFSPTKDLAACFDIILPHALSITLTQSDRLASVETLKKYAPQSRLEPSPKKAVELASKPLLVCGSFYIMHEAKQYERQ